MFGYAWICLDMREYAWIYLDMLGYDWICLDMLEYAWICWDMFGYAWICLDMLGYACISRMGNEGTQRKHKGDPIDNSTRTKETKETKMGSTEKWWQAKETRRGSRANPT